MSMLYPMKKINVKTMSHEKVNVKTVLKDILQFRFADLVTHRKFNANLIIINSLFNGSVICFG